MNIYNKCTYMLTIFLHTSLISFSCQGAQLLRHYSNRRSLPPKYLYNNIGKDLRLTRATFSTHLVGQPTKTYGHYYWLSYRTLTSSFWGRIDLEKINDSLLKAAQNGDVRKLTKALAKGASLYTTDQNDNNALHLAAACAPEGQSISWLIDQAYFSIEAKNEQQKTPFLCAAAGNLAALKILKEKGANVEAIDQDGNNALHLAALYAPRKEVIEWLIQNTYIPIDAKGYHQKTAFICAAEKGNLDCLKILLAKGANRYATDQNGNNALHYAALYDSEGSVIEWLIDMSLPIEAQNNSQKTPFLFAAEKGNLLSLKILRAKGANLSTVDQNGNNALHLASLCSSDEESITWLIDTAKIDIEAQNRYQRTPFLCAAEKGHLPTFKTLQKKGANLYMTDRNGNNALHLAALYCPSECSIEWLMNTAKIPIEAKGFHQRTPFLTAAEKGNLGALKILKENGANLYAIDQEGNNALHLAALYAPKGKGINWLIDEIHLSIEAENNNKKTAFLCAAEKGNLPALKLLQQKGAKLDVRDQYGNNALHLASLYAPDEEVIKWLIGTAEVSMESRNHQHKTPFLCAAEKGNLPALKVLQTEGADQYVTDWDGKNALLVAASYSPSMSAIQWLIGLTKMHPKWGGERDFQTAVLYAAKEGNLPALKALQAEGANLSATHLYNEKNALHLAASFSSDDQVIGWLIDVAQISIESKDVYLATPFLCAAAEGNLPALKILLAKGANIYATDQNGSNALHLATLSYSPTKVIEWLIDVAKIDIESQGYYEATPFLFAAEKGNLPALKILKKKGANLNVTDQDGYNALHYAALYAPEGNGIAWLLDTAKLTIDLKGCDQKNAFLFAAEKGNLPAIEILKEKGANLYAIDQNGYNALALAKKHSANQATIDWLEKELGVKKKRFFFF